MPCDVARDRVERLLGRLQEVLLEQQVLGRIAGQHQLGEQHQLGAGVARRRDVLAHQPGVALEVADARVDLRKGEGERCERAGHVARQAGCSARRRRLRGLPETPATAASSAIAPSSAAARSSRSGNAS